jgi:cytochrome c5
VAGRWRTAIIFGFGRPGCRCLPIDGLVRGKAQRAAATEDFMSDPQEHDAPHEGPIKTPQQLIWTVVASFVVPIAIIVLLVSYVSSGDKGGAGSMAMSEEAIAQRIQPVGMVMLKDASAVVAVRTGEQVYAAQCTACHAAGLAGAPKSGDEAAWAPRIKTGYEALLNSVLKGKGAMAAQGGGEFSDYEIGRAVVYLANKGGAKFDEPKAPAAAASAASAPN